MGCSKGIMEALGRCNDDAVCVCVGGAKEIECVRVVLRTHDGMLGTCAGEE